MSDLHQIFAALDGAEIPGGCEHCDAFQVPSVDGFGILHLRIHHDDWCPWLAQRKENSK